MKVPAQYSRFAGRPWIRETINGDEVMWRPYRVETFSMGDTEPVAVVRATAGESLYSLAAKYYKGIDRPEQLAWLIAEVNDIVDPTISIEGMDIIIPPISVFEGEG